jgi:predicted RNase H-like nuclease (RuvC/YqgF family)
MSQPKSISEYRQALKAAEAKNAHLEARVERLEERVRELEAAQRAAKRQAAPFPRGKRQASIPDAMAEYIDKHLRGR